jgi:hypothetical protein
MLDRTRPILLRINPESETGRPPLTGPRRPDMMQTVTVLLFLKDLALATLVQMAYLAAGVFIFGLLIQLVSQFTFRSLEKTFGRWGTYLVAWLGTPVHELGHVVFCIIFRHRIVEMSLFKPDPNTGTLGYVYHRWDRRNPWQVMGNFFIGIGPVVLGSGVLFILFYFLVPGGPETWGSILSGMNGAGAGGVGGYLEALWDSSLAMLKTIFILENLAGWRFWVFLYLCICVAANLRLSLADVRGSLSGLLYVLLPFFVVNLVIMLVSETGGPPAAGWLGAAYGLLTLALVMVVIGFVLVYLFSAVIYRLMYRATLKPF